MRASSKQMLDAFEVMGVERLLSMDLEALKCRYDSLSRERHPDHGGEAKEFDELRESYEVLKDPVRRLRHWLGLYGQKPGVVDDAETMQLFGQVGDLMTKSEVVLEKKAGARSALATSLAELEAIGLLAEVEKLLDVLGGEKERLLKMVDASGGDSESVRDELVGVAGRLVFLDKWEGQLRDRWVRLGLS